MNGLFIIKRIAAYIITAVIYGFIAGTIITLLSNMFEISTTLLTAIQLLIYAILVVSYGEIGKKLMKLQVVDITGEEVKGLELLKSSTIIHVMIYGLIATIFTSIPVISIIISFIPTIYLVLLILNKDIWHMMFGHQVVEKVI